MVRQASRTPEVAGLAHAGDNAIPEASEDQIDRAASLGSFPADSRSSQPGKNRVVAYIWGPSYPLTLIKPEWERL
jgi:hypothetical protein